MRRCGPDMFMMTKSPHVALIRLLRRGCLSAGSTARRRSLPTARNAGELAEVSGDQFFEMDSDLRLSFVSTGSSRSPPTAGW